MSDSIKKVLMFFFGMLQMIKIKLKKIKELKNDISRYSHSLIENMNYGKPIILHLE